MLDVLMLAGALHDSHLRRRGRDLGIDRRRSGCWRSRCSCSCRLALVKRYTELRTRLLQAGREPQRRRGYRRSTTCRLLAVARRCQRLSRSVLVLALYINSTESRRRCIAHPQALWLRLPAAAVLDQPRLDARAPRRHARRPGRLRAHATRGSQLIGCAIGASCCSRLERLIGARGRYRLVGPLPPRASERMAPRARGARCRHIAQGAGAAARTATAAATATAASTTAALLIDTRGLDRFIAFDDDRRAALRGRRAAVATSSRVRPARLVPAGHARHAVRHRRRRHRQRRPRQEPPRRRHLRPARPALELLRSDGERLDCSPERRTRRLFAATIGGLGLTGLITSGDDAAAPIASPLIDAETVRFDALDEFFALAAASPTATTNTRWPGSTARRTAERLGRGLFMRGNHAGQAHIAHATTPARRCASPFDAAVLAGQRAHPARRSTRSTTTASASAARRRVVRYRTFFYPLDAHRRLEPHVRRRAASSSTSASCPTPAQPKRSRELLDAIAASRQRLVPRRTRSSSATCPRPDCCRSRVPASRWPSTSRTAAPRHSTLLERLDEIVDATPAARSIPPRTRACPRDDVPPLFPALGGVSRAHRSRVSRPASGAGSSRDDAEASSIFGATSAIAEATAGCSPRAATRCSWSPATPSTSRPSPTTCAYAARRRRHGDARRRPMRDRATAALDRRPTPQWAVSTPR